MNGCEFVKWSVSKTLSECRSVLQSNFQVVGVSLVVRLTSSRTPVQCSTMLLEYKTRTADCCFNTRSVKHRDLRTRSFQPMSYEQIPAWTYKRNDCLNSGSNACTAQNR
jgi:hypothetical protein